MVRLLKEDGLQTLLADNISVLFIVSLFYAAVAGVSLTRELRMTLVYAFSYLTVLFGSVNDGVVIIGSLLVSFLLLEIFTADTELARSFSARYKLQDWLFRMLASYCLVFFLLTIALTGYFARNDKTQILAVCIGVISLLLLSLRLARPRFSIKGVEEMYAALHKLSSMGDLQLFESNKNKYDILIEIEDKDFFHREEDSHAITLSRVWQGISRRFDIKKLHSPIKNTRHLFSRGYATIEMQLIRTIGLELGSYSRKYRRKAFEMLYSNMVFNSYIQRYGESSLPRKHAKEWILQSYIDNVSVQFGGRLIVSANQGTIQELFGKKSNEISDEEFFVWCLGLPCYKKGVGANAVRMHQSVVDKHELNENDIFKAINIINYGKTRQ